jgi:molybdopterin-biosynthesis enzyme MoeA-like protein
MPELEDPSQLLFLAAPHFPREIRNQLRKFIAPRQHNQSSARSRHSLAFFAVPESRNGQTNSVDMGN